MVSDCPSNTEGGGGGQRSTPRFAYTEKFNHFFPYYLAIGMTPEQYWEGDCQWAKAFRQAAQIRQDLQNQQAWLQGAYVYEALVDISPSLRAMGAKKPTPYRKEPFDLNTRKDMKYRHEAEQKNDDKARAFMEAFALSTNKKFQEKGGGVNG